ncbi:MAG: Druantia anti-phage system protein DruA [Planctomycetota bacterium]
MRQRILEALRAAGFRINPHVRPPSENKNTLRRLQKNARLEQLALHRKFLSKNLKKALSYCRNGRDISPAGIELELRQVERRSFEETMFRWWNFVWWSIPYQRSYGRQMRFLLWDKGHDAPFGLITLQSPVLKMSVRDKALDIPKEELHVWVNRSLHAQRVGALPPYNELLGGKMVALALSSNEIRRAYKKKYEGSVSLINGEELPAQLLFVTTTSAFGRSSIYNRLRYDGQTVGQCLGYTQGTGSFHIPEDLYQELLAFLVELGHDISRGYGHGPSRKLKLLSVGLRHLGLAEFEFHGVKREFYLFPHAKNLETVIRCGKRPMCFNRPFEDLVTYWKERWALPRSQRNSKWRDFSVDTFRRQTKSLLRRS